MAKPIRDIHRVEPTPEQVQAQAIQDLIKAIADNRETILDLLEIVRQLQEMGVLAIIKGLLENRHDVGLIAIQQLNQPKMHHLLKNAVTLVQGLGEIEPVRVQKMFHGLSRGLEASEQVMSNGKTPSLWEMAKYARDPAIRLSMATMLAILRGMGESFRDESNREEK
ncbi:hypothetical protein GCM10011571_08070 [Marinithermofilum abyssi]|uniref:DUF1641 domain-containing protein n=1 Tax=Marinithermofilum abyssi TaxID=1571185 RepID=A0A8J2VCJ9_9BACL|nr:DUF1641 domain-containing protein [Marinithermofilum abyssi]GGE09122.1 hypothetical protein GCM10011571_08070 [Marinithermofilum abyssi]